MSSSSIEFTLQTRLEEDHEFLEFSKSIGVDEEEIRRQLSDEDYNYLKTK